MPAVRFLDAGPVDRLRKVTPLPSQEQSLAERPPGVLRIGLTPGSSSAPGLADLEQESDLSGRDQRRSVWGRTLEHGAWAERGPWPGPGPPGPRPWVRVLHKTLVVSV